MSATNETDRVFGQPAGARGEDEGTAGGAPRRALFSGFRERVLQALSREVPPMLPLGFPALDLALGGGFPAPGIVVLAAPPKHHKTAFIIDLIHRLCKRGERVVYVTTELTGQEVYARLAARTLNDRSHRDIKYDTAGAERHTEALGWMAGTLDVWSLPDERRECSGMGWREVLAACTEAAPAPLFIADYLEMLADLETDGGREGTDQSANKAVMRALQAYVNQNQARVLAVCSVARGTYGNVESIFSKADARPEEFAAVGKHSGYIEYAATALLALQLPGGDAKIIDPETGREALPIKLHLAFTREGAGPQTVKLLSSAGTCYFREDMRSDEALVAAERERTRSLEQRILYVVKAHGKPAGQREVLRLLGSIPGKTTAKTAALNALVKNGDLNCKNGKGKSLIYTVPPVQD